MDALPFFIANSQHFSGVSNFISFSSFFRMAFCSSAVGMIVRAGDSEGASSFGWEKKKKKYDNNNNNNNKKKKKKK
jgi:hypothetical protein